MSTTSELAPFEVDEPVGTDVGTSTAGEITDEGPVPEIPKFEGKDVAAAVVEFSGNLKGLPDDPNLVIGIDDRVRLAGVYRVTEVKHVIDPATGEIIRKQILRPVTMDRIPFDPADPSDDGVLRG